MKEHPIIFSAEMVRAILRGDKTQTRRVVKVPPPLTKLMNQQPTGYCVIPLPTGEWVFEKAKGHSVLRAGEPFRCPYGVAGDRLWVRETHYLPHNGGATIDGDWESRVLRDPSLVKYVADGERVVIGWYDKPYRHCLVKHPSIHMPRWASRISLEIVNVRVERLQEITTVDVCNEGFVWKSFELGTGYGLPNWSRGIDAQGAFANLWNSINDKRGYGWDKNPFVWVIEFKRI